QVPDLAAVGTADLAHPVQVRGVGGGAGVLLPGGGGDGGRADDRGSSSGRAGAGGVRRGRGRVGQSSQGHQTYHIVEAGDRDLRSIGGGDGVQDPADVTDIQPDLLTAAVQSTQSQLVRADTTALAVGLGGGVGDHHREGGAAQGADL